MKEVLDGMSASELERFESSLSEYMRNRLGLTCRCDKPVIMGTGRCMHCNGYTLSEGGATKALASIRRRQSHAELGKGWAGEWRRDKTGEIPFLLAYIEKLERRISDLEAEAKL